jgi:hypothetical protein
VTTVDSFTRDVARYEYPVDFLATGSNQVYSAASAYDGGGRDVGVWGLVEERGSLLRLRGTSSGWVKFTKSTNGGTIYLDLFVSHVPTGVYGADKGLWRCESSVHTRVNVEFTNGLE